MLFLPNFNYYSIRDGLDLLVVLTAEVPIVYPDIWLFVGSQPQVDPVLHLQQGIPHLADPRLHLHHQPLAILAANVLKVVDDFLELEVEEDVDFPPELLQLGVLLPSTMKVFPEQQGSQHSEVGDFHQFHLQGVLADVFRRILKLLILSHESGQPELLVVLR